MDVFLALVGIIFILLGIIGSFLPVLPGPITGWFGLFILHLTSVVPLNWSFLSITLGIAILIWLMDYVIPAMGTKKYGGSKYGVWGTTVGLFLGLVFMGPLGIIIGPFLGAFIGEMMYNSKDSNRAMRAAFGSFIGFLFSTGLKFLVSLIYAGLYLSIVWNYRSVWF